TRLREGTGHLQDAGDVLCTKRVELAGDADVAAHRLHVQAAAQVPAVDVAANRPQPEVTPSVDDRADPTDRRGANAALDALDDDVAGDTLQVQHRLERHLDVVLNGGRLIVVADQLRHRANHLGGDLLKRRLVAKLTGRINDRAQEHGVAVLPRLDPGGVEANPRGVRLLRRPNADLWPVPAGDPDAAARVLHV